MVPVAAGAYKGLTIRIGADTTKLSSALRGADSAIYKTQNQLKKLTQALKFDTGNKDLTKRQIGAMAEQAINTYQKIDILKKGIKELSEVKVLGKDNVETDKTIGQLADETEDANLKAEESKSIWTSVNAELEDVYRNIKKATGVDLAAATRAGNFQMGLESAKQAAKDMGVDISADIAKIEELKPKWAEARAAMDNYANVAKLKSLANELGLSDVALKKLISDYVELRKQQNLTSKSDFGKSPSFEAMDSRMTLLTAATTTAIDRFRTLDSAAKIDPSNLDIARQRADALAEAIDATQQHASELREKIAAYEADGLEASAEDAKNLSIELAEAEARYAAIEDEIADVSVRLAEAGDASKVFREDSQQISSGMDEATASAAELDAKFEELEQSRKQALDELSTAKARSELANMKVELIQDETKARQLGNAFSSIKVQSNIAASLKPINEELRAVSAGVNTAKSRFEILNNAAQIKPHNLSIAVDRLRAFREAIDASRTKAELLKQKLDAFKATGIDKIANNTKNAAVSFELAQKKVNDLNQKLAETKVKEGATSAEAKRLEAALAAAMREADTAAAVNEFKDLEAQLREVTTEAENMKKSMKVNFGEIGAATVQAASQIGQLAERAGREIITSSNDIDASYRDLRKTFDAEEKDYKTLYDAAMQYSQAHVTSADKMLEMEAIAAQLGVGVEGGAKAIQVFAEACADLDVATDIDAETIALQLGQITNVMNDLKPETARNFADALVRLGNNMPTQESNIMQITQRLSAIGDVAHFSTPELMGWAAAIASTGQKSEAAASGIATTITKIGTAVSVGGDDLKKWAKVADMSAKDFKRAWRDDPSETLKKVITGLKNSGDELFATLAGVDVTGVRQTQTLAALAQTVDTVDTSIGMATNAFNGITDEFGKSGDAANEANKKAQGFSGTLAKLQNTAQVLGATLGDAMVPWMNKLSGALNWLTGVINSWSDETKSNVVLAAGSFAAFASAWPIISALGSSLSTLVGGALSAFVGGIAKVIVYGKGFISLMGSFAAAPAEVASALSGVGGAAGALGTALGFLATPIGVVVGALGLLAVALGGEYIAKTMAAKKSAEEFQGALEGIKGVTEDLGQSLYLGGDAIDDYADKWSAARIDMGKYHEELQGHIDKQMEARTAMEQTVGSLDKYQSIVSKAIGKGEKFTGNIGELQYAIDKLNDLTGSSWTLQDVLTGKYKDEEGAIRSTKTALDELIASKKLEAQIGGIESALSENEAAKSLNKRNRDLAASAYQDWIDLKLDQKANNVAFSGMTDSEYIKWLQANDEHTQELMFDNKKLRTEARLLDEQYEELTHTLGGLIDQQSYKTSSNYGERESIMRLNTEAEDALRTFMGFTDGTIEDGTKRIAQGMQDLKVGTTEFAEMSTDTFANLAEKSGGDIDKFLGHVDKWNQAHLEEKYGKIEWGDETKTWFIDAYNRRVEWNGDEWEVKNTSVEVDDTQLDEAESKEQEVKDKAAEGVEMDVTTNDSELDETSAKIDSQTDEEKTVTYNADDSALDEAQGKAESLEDKEIKITFNVDDGGVSEAKSALDELDNKEIKVSIKADTAGASAITDALAGLDGKPVDVKINADTSGAQQITDALAGLSGKPIDVKINADTTGAQLVAEAINSIPDQKTSNVRIDADTGAAQMVNDVLNGIPPVTTATIAAVTQGVQAATDRILKLNTASGAMKSEKKTYEAKGNAATSSSPASNIKSLNGAAGGMSSKSATYTAYGNAANGSAASHVWELVRAIERLSSKSVTVTTNYVNHGSPGKSASGAYVPYNKIPRHAAGIFTRPTLTNIGWVGEAGAELYSGNSLVPLTNRKYSMPYIDDISDAVAKKLGNAGTSYNVSIDGARINDDPAIQAAILNLFDVLQRKGAMNRG